MMSTQRLDYFDWMKGITIVLVVMGHVMTFVFGITEADIHKLGMLRMPIFFYISGYFAGKVINETRALREQLWKKTRGLLIPYFVFLGLWAIFRKRSFAELFLTGGDGYWFLWVLWLLSIFFIIYGYLTRNVRSVWIYIILWLIPYAAIIICNKHFPSDNPQLGWIALPLITSYYRYYLLGYLCRKINVINNVLFNNIWVGALAFVCFLAKWLFYDYHSVLLSFAGTLGAIIVIQRLLMSFSGKHNKTLSLFSFLGNKTMVIYVLHYFFLPNLSSYGHYLMGGDNVFIVHFTVALLVSIPIVLASVLLGRLIESNNILSVVMLGKIKQ